MIRALICAAVLLFAVPVNASDALPEELAPEAEVAALRAAEVAGTKAFRHDRAAWIATDALGKFRGFKRDKRVRGWVTTETGGGIAVTVIGVVDGVEPQALYRATVDDNFKLVGKAVAVRARGAFSP